MTPLYKGYTDKILYINLSDNSIVSKDVSPLMKEKFIGGKGYGLESARNSIQTVFDIRNKEKTGLIGDYHPLAKTHKF